MWYNSNLHIHLFNEQIVFRGCRDTASGHALRGYLLLSLRGINKITSIQLSLQGVASVPSETTEIFLQHNVEFLEVTQNPKSFHSGTYMYHFELPLTGDLPESVNSRNGCIQYSLKAVAKREGFSLQSELLHERSVYISRVHSIDFDDINSQELLKFGEIHGELGFTIYSNSNSYQPGQEVNLNIGTKLLNTTSKIESIQACIVEAVRYRTKNGDIKSTKRPLIETIKYEDLRKYKPTVHSNSIQILIDSSIQTDCKSDMLSLSHLIEIQICLLNGSGMKKYILVRTPIHISNKEEDTLPLYSLSTPTSPPAYT
ncbi:hypothetical protein K7432_006138 [Basidiobolus ranarum]|uniref:Arrestin C-terminal-like domain-containing protein n=1 Tax=Basidiobolus ranarum TaxID=34480 RepID=A0ABR2WVG2_9FUNG